MEFMIIEIEREKGGIIKIVILISRQINPKKKEIRSKRGFLVKLRLI